MMRDFDLVICCGMRRSGSSLVYRVLAELLNSNFVNIGFVNLIHFEEVITRHCAQRLLIKSHDFYPAMFPQYREMIFGAKTGIVMSVRDIRDCVASYTEIRRKNAIKCEPVGEIAATISGE